MKVDDKVRVDTWLGGRKGKGAHVIGMGTITKKWSRYYHIRMDNGVLLSVPRKDCKKA